MRRDLTRQVLLQNEVEVGAPYLAPEPLGAAPERRAPLKYLF